jgi:integrase
LLLGASTPGHVVSEMMGHADYAIKANRYQHVADELQLIAADSLVLLRYGGRFVTGP